MESIENENLSTEVTAEEYAAGIEDEFGVIYSADGKRLLCANKERDSYIIKDGTEVICNDAFWMCAKLKQITIPDSVSIIGDNAFDGCLLLKQIVLPESVESIGQSAFIRCESLKKICLPKSLKNIGRFSFCGCKNLKITSYSSRYIVTDGLLIDNQEQRLNSFVGNAKNVVIPKSVTAIGEGAFKQCESLRHITIPDSIVEIGFAPFYKCRNVKLKSESSRFIVQDNMLIDKQNKFLIAYTGNDKNIAIPDSVTTIGDVAFSYHKSLKHINIPNTITTIGNQAFSWCNTLRQIIIPDSVTSIGDWTFAYCESLLQITIPDSVKYIGDRAFYACESLQQITIPEGTTEKFKEMLSEELWNKLIENQQ